MPGTDRRGPLGMGPLTGRGMGLCRPGNNRGFGSGYGYGYRKWDDTQNLHAEPGDVTQVRSMAQELRNILEQLEHWIGNLPKVQTEEKGAEDKE